MGMVEILRSAGASFARFGKHVALGRADFDSSAQCPQMRHHCPSELGTRLSEPESGFVLENARMCILTKSWARLLHPTAWVVSDRARW